MEDGRILERLHQEGESVSTGQILFAVETDKAAIEVPAEVSGTLLKVIVPIGETVPIASIIASVGEPNQVIPVEKEPKTQSNDGYSKG